MKCLSALIVLTFLLTGYAAAAHAFGQLAPCPMNGGKMTMAVDMKDCCDHAAQTPAKGSCAACDWCCAMTAVTLPAVIPVLRLAASLPDIHRLPLPRADFDYPALRPPNAAA